MEYIAFAIAVIYGIALWLVCGSSPKIVNACSKYYQVYAGSQYLFTRGTMSSVWGYLPTAVNYKHSLYDVNIYECDGSTSRLIYTKGDAVAGIKWPTQ